MNPPFAFWRCRGTEDRPRRRKRRQEPRVGGRLQQKNAARSRWPSGQGHHKLPLQGQLAEGPKQEAYRHFLHLFMLLVFGRCKKSNCRRCFLCSFLPFRGNLKEILLDAVKLPNLLTNSQARGRSRAGRRCCRRVQCQGFWVQNCSRSIQKLFGSAD